jgi:pimeloyl-ACP methyl ester carboxylesterase
MDSALEAGREALTTASLEPTSRFYDSQGLRLHYVDWGNEIAPPVVLLHGGRDHCRSWDWIARALQPHFHVMAADLRGHGDSDWAKGSSYSFADHIYDMARMVAACGVEQMALVGHSYGGMIAMAYAGAYPDKVSRLAVLDGAFLRSAASSPIERQIARWVADLDKVSAAKAWRYRTVEEAAARMSEKNKRLTREQVLHLATHAVKQNADGTLSWKYDPAQRVNPPYRLAPADYIALWNRIACPTLLLSAAESNMPDPEKAGILKHFKHARQKIIEGAGHWLQHDKLDEVLGELRALLEVQD